MGSVKQNGNLSVIKCKTGSKCVQQTFRGKLTAENNRRIDILQSRQLMIYNRCFTLEFWLDALTLTTFNPSRFELNVVRG